LQNKLPFTLRIPYQFDPSSLPSCSPSSYSDKLILDLLLTFLVAFSTLALKLSFSQSLSVNSRLSVPQADLLEMAGITTTRCLAATGGGSIQAGPEKV